MPYPLEGVRILELGQIMAGTYGSQVLSDLGAEVIKVENPKTGGDASRGVGPHLLGRNDSLYFQTWHSNKKSVALDIKTPEGRRAFEGLVAGADAVVNNLRGDQPDKVGLDYTSLSSLNDRIVCVHISAYGRDNERKGWPGYDFLMQAEAGLMSVTGEPDGPPARIGVSMVDFMSGMTAMVGLLSAVMQAQRTGKGCDVDASLFDVALHQLSYSALWYLNGGEMPTRLPRGAHLGLAPVQSYRTADGWIFVMCMTDRFWEALVDAMGRSELKSDPRFDSQAGRRDNRDALTLELDGTFQTRPTRKWLDVLEGVVPVAPIHDVAEALNNPFVDRLGMLNELAHPLNPQLKVLANPLKIDGTRPAQRPGSALGADNDELLGAEETRRRGQAGS